MSEDLKIPKVNLPPEMQIPTMLTLKEAAEVTGLSYEYLRKLCLQNRIVYIRTGNKYLLNLEKLVDYLQEGDET